MAITQQTYTERIGKARNGQIANMHTCDVDPYIVEGANGIGWGVAVQRGSSQNKVKVGIDALSFLGIAVLDPTQTESEGGGTKYPAGSHAGILYRGDMFIAPFEAVRAGDIVTVRAL